MIVNAVTTILNILFNLYSDLIKRVRMVDVRLHGPWESERWDRKCWVFELVFTIRAPRGAKVPGKLTNRNVTLMITK